MNLVTRETFPNRLEPLPPPFGTYIKLTPEQKKAKQVSFKFDGIPKNNYFLIAFQDLNNNGKLDRDYWGVPEEPYGSYKKFEFAVQWDRDSFLLDKDFTEIKGDCYGKNMELRARLHRPQDLEKPVRYFLTGAGFSVSFT